MARARRRANPAPPHGAGDARRWLHEAKLQAWPTRMKITDADDSPAARDEQALADLLAEILQYNDLLDFAADRYRYPRNVGAGDEIEPRLCDLQRLWDQATGPAARL